MRSDRVYIIAEAGVNHNGDLRQALQMVDVAVKSKANAIKFQTFRTEDLVSKQAPKAAYQSRNDKNSQSQFDMLKKLELSDSDHIEILSYCNKHKIDFLSTPFDLGSLNFLVNKLGMDTVKIPSGEITNGPFLFEISKIAKKIILSTGMSTLSEIKTALGVIAFGFCSPDDYEPNLEKFEVAFKSDLGQSLLQQRVVILHATTEYPAPPAEINLNAMKTIYDTFKIPVGYSDHSKGIHIPIAAVALGAIVIEKHFTLDQKSIGPDHKASLEPNELYEMVKNIRDTETAMGDGNKIPTLSEINNIPIARKSLHASRVISKNESFSTDNLTSKRPGNGLSPMNYWEFLGSKSNKNYSEDDLINNFHHE